MDMVFYNDQEQAMNKNLQKKIPVGVLGATGMVGQKFIQLLENHPWFRVVCIAASKRSAGRTYGEAVRDRWCQDTEIPSEIKIQRVYEVGNDLGAISNRVAFAFSALSMPKEQIREIEERYAESGVPIVSNNSAHRWTADVPMMIPEVNPHHSDLIDIQRNNRKWKKGFIIVKPNCSTQSFVPVLDAWKAFEPLRVIVSTYQSISGAGKTFTNWPEMRDNVIPFIPGEEKKSEMEPLKILGTIQNQSLVMAAMPQISATCVRVPVTDGHMISASVAFKNKPSGQDLLDAITEYKNPIKELNLPSEPEEFLKYFNEEDRPQTLSERLYGKGMSITVGRLREDPVLHWKFIALSHNTIRGAAGGAILTAELLTKKGYLSGE
jgi:aspartate-semialdehyde dehydrogenase